MNKHQFNPVCTFQVIDVDGYPISVSTIDFPRVIQYHWYISAYGYATTGHDNQLMHRLILGLTEFSALEVHHKDGNRLNNTRENLQTLDRSTHLVTRPKQTNNQTGFKGVSWKNQQGNRRGAYIAQIAKDRVKIHIGRFKTAEDAARAYDKKAFELFGEAAFLNFPNERSS